MPTTTGPIDRLHLLIEPRNFRQGRGSPQCDVRRGLGLGLDAGFGCSCFAGLPILLRNKGVWRGTWHATQHKEWEGIPATGRKAKWTAIIIGRFEVEKLAEDWVEYDRYNLFRQLGAL